MKNVEDSGSPATPTFPRCWEANRLHKALEDTGIKLDCVATDILGVSGRAMLDALVQGTTDPDVLADLAKGRLRAKIPALKQALEGSFDHLRAVWIEETSRPRAKAPLASASACTGRRMGRSRRRPSDSS